MKHPRRHLTVWTALAAVAAIAMYFVSTGRGQSPIHIAVVTTLRADGDGIAMYEAAKLHIDQINDADGIHGRPIELSLFDDGGICEPGGRAQDIAREIARQNKFVAVIGHYYSTCAIDAGGIYKAHGIPVITPGATHPDVTRDNAWHFRVIPNDDVQGRFLATYTKYILKRNTASIIHHDQAYGTYLASVFERRAKEIGMDIKYKWMFQSRTENKKHNIQQIMHKLRSKEDAGVIFLSTYGAEGPGIIRSMHDTSIYNTIIALEGYASSEFIEPHKKQIDLESISYNAQEFYILSSFLFETANRAAQKFKRDFIEKYQIEPGWLAAYSFDASLVLTKALQSISTNKSIIDILSYRNRIRDYLLQLNHSSTAIQGITGLIYFDEEGDLNKHLLVTNLKRGNIVPAPTQIRKINNYNKIMTLKKDFKSEMIVKIDDEYVSKTSLIYTGVKINHIEKVNYSTLYPTFTVDFSIWFRYQKPVIPNDIEFLNALEPVELGLAIIDETVGDISYRLYRVKGRFRSDIGFIPSRPNQRSLTIRFHHRHLVQQHLIFVPDIQGMGLSQDDGFDTQLQQNQMLEADDKSRVLRSTIYQDTIRINTLGNPHYDGPIVYSRLNTEIQIAKHGMSLRFLIPSGTAVYFLLFSLLLILGVRLAVMVSPLKYIARFRWFILVFALLLLLLAAEVMVLDWCGSYPSLARHIEAVYYFFDVLWWVTGASLLVSAISNYIWDPLSTSSGRPIPNGLRACVTIVVYMVALLAIIAFVFERPITSLLATSGLAMAMIGLAIQVNINDIFSGIILNLERPFRVGDWIQVDDETEGRVVDISWRVTRLQTREANIVNIPNGATAEAKVVNYYAPSRVFVIHLMVQVTPHHAPDRVRKVLLDALLSSHEILKDPEPSVVLHDITDRGAVYQASGYADDFARRGDIYNAAWRRIWAHLQGAGMAYPAMDSDATTATSPNDNVTESHRANLLRTIDVFQSLPEASIRLCSDNMRRRHFWAGETIVEQGQTGDSLFVINEGVVSVSLRLEDESSTEVARLGARDFFGERSLLTGEERTATIAAITDTEVYELTKNDILPIMQDNPEGYEILSQILTQRQLQSASQVELMSRTAEEIEDTRLQILRRIREFFGAS